MHKSYSNVMKSLCKGCVEASVKAVSKCRQFYTSKFGGSLSCANTADLYSTFTDLYHASARGAVAKSTSVFGALSTVYTPLTNEAIKNIN